MLAFGGEVSNITNKEPTTVVLKGSKQSSRTGNKIQKWKKLVRNGVPHNASISCPILVGEKRSQAMEKSDELMLDSEDRGCVKKRSVLMEVDQSFLQDS